MFNRVRQLTKKGRTMKQKQSKQRTNKYIRRTAASLAVILVLVVAVSQMPFAWAQSLQEQIDQLSRQNSDTQGQVSVLEDQAVDFNDKISKLQQEINGLQEQINQSVAQIDATQAKINEAEVELAKQRQLLGQNIRAMYVEGDVSTLEMLASSQDLSDFVDKQQYRNSVKDKIKATLDKVNELKHQLNAEKEILEAQKKDQETRQARLNGQRAEQDRLLSLNESQRNELNGQIKNNSAKIAELRKQQAAENAKLFGGSVPQGIPGGGGYPGAWAFAPIDSIIDTWGMYNRECVSYTAWKVWSSGRYMPYWGGIGNANQWDDNARAAGIPVDTNPRVGDVAIKNAGFYGHAMYVEHVYGDGTIYISQYNAAWDGNYSEARISTAGLVFIHF